MSINAVGSASFQASNAMTNLASGRRINSAADDAAGLAISEQMESQTRGIEQGTNNTHDMQNLINTAEGSLNEIQNNLQRIRELALQAANDTNTDDDRRLIQTEVNQLLNEIVESADRAQFNTINLLDGEAQNLHTVSSPDGSGAVVSMPDISQMAQDLLNNVNVATNSITDTLDRIDDALNQVGEARGELGAMSNRMDHTINSNSITMLNQAAAKSRIADADIGRSVAEQNRDQVINDMRILMQQQQQEQEQRRTQLIM